MDHSEQIRAWLPTVADTLIPTDFHVQAIALLCETFQASPEQLMIDWRRVQWFGLEGGVEVPLMRPELATTEPATLPRLVFAAHDMGIRVEIRTMRFHTVRLVLRPRPYRSGSGRAPLEHPTLARALQTWRGLGSPSSLGHRAFESDVPLSDEQRHLDPAGRYGDPTVQLWFRIWEMGVQHAQAAAAIQQSPRPDAATAGETP